jgi:hypothetical protein
LYHFDCPKQKSLQKYAEQVTYKHDGKSPSLKMQILILGLGRA